MKHEMDETEGKSEESRRWESEGKKKKSWRWRRLREK